MTNELVNAFATQQASPEELWTWACDALESGADSPHLRVLSGLIPPADSDEVARYFRLSLTELGIALPSSPDIALRDRLWLIASQLVSGAVELTDALHRIHWQVISPLQHPRDLQQWCFLDEALDPDTYEDLSPQRLRDRVLAKAEEYVHSYSPSFNDRGA